MFTSILAYIFASILAYIFASILAYIFAMLMMSANTPAAVTLAPAP